MFHNVVWQNTQGVDEFLITSWQLLQIRIRTTVEASLAINFRIEYF